MFHNVMEIVSIVGDVLKTLPAAARVAGDVEIGRHPSDSDLRSLGLPTDINM